MSNTAKCSFLNILSLKFPKNSIHFSKLYQKMFLLEHFYLSILSNPPPLYIILVTTHSFSPQQDFHFFISLLKNNHSTQLFLLSFHILSNHYPPDISLVAFHSFSPPGRFHFSLY